MTQRFELIQDAIARESASLRTTSLDEIRAALRDASEAERAELVGPLTKLLTYWRGQERADGRYWAQRQLTEVVLLACEPDSPAMRKRLLLHYGGTQIQDLIADRRPPWAEQVMNDLYATALPRDLLGDNAWTAAEHLRRIVGGPRPLDERNVVPLGLEVARQIPLRPLGEPDEHTGVVHYARDGSPATVLRAWPDGGEVALAVLRSPLLGKISSTMYWSSKAEMSANGWPRAFVDLVEESILDRDEVLNILLELLIANEATPPTVTQRFVTLQLLAPTPEEVTARRSAWEALAQSPRKNLASYATKQLKSC